MSTWSCLARLLNELLSKVCLFYVVVSTVSRRWFICSFVYALHPLRAVNMYKWPKIAFGPSSQGGFLHHHRHQSREINIESFT